MKMKNKQTFGYAISLNGELMSVGSSSNIVENCKPNNTWNLVIGKKTYQELLLESQKNIHLLDELEPKTDEEHEKQLDTLEYLKKELNWE
jgi:hypothetical protein